jgi:hypothetical protein
MLCRLYPHSSECCRKSTDSQSSTAGAASLNSTMVQRSSGHRQRSRGLRDSGLARSSAGLCLPAHRALHVAGRSLSAAAGPSLPRPCACCVQTMQHAMRAPPRAFSMQHTSATTQSQAANLSGGMLPKHPSWEAPTPGARLCSRRHAGKRHAAQAAAYHLAFHQPPALVPARQPCPIANWTCGRPTWRTGSMPGRQTRLEPVQEALMPLCWPSCRPSRRACAACRAGLSACCWTATSLSARQRSRRCRLATPLLRRCLHAGRPDSHSLRPVKKQVAGLPAGPLQQPRRHLASCALRRLCSARRSASCLRTTSYWP